MISRLISFIVFTVTLIFSSSAQELKSGDLLFVIDSDSSFSSAITDATKALSDSLSFVHVAILEVQDDLKYNVIEANPKYGVRIVELKEFLEDTPKVNGAPGIIVKRLKIDFPITQSLQLARQHLGEKYDWWYLPDNDKMYCSELVYDSFLDSNGERIFEAKPMNFRKADGSMPEFWIKLFKELDSPIPEGLPGTNPNDLSKNPYLIEIYRYF